MTKTNNEPAILDVIRDLYCDAIVADYNRFDDYIRVDLHDGTWVAVGPDVDPEHPELDDTATGYVWTAYEDDAGLNAIDCGGDTSTATLDATIRRLATT